MPLVFCKALPLSICTLKAAGTIEAEAQLDVFMDSNVKVSALEVALTGRPELTAPTAQMFVHT